jgi:molybdopterin-guanine dinucleotide biosynthesis protein A
MGKDKGLCEFQGKALINYAIDVLTPICGKILISSNNVVEYQKFGYQVVIDEHKNIGPMGGIYSSLRKSSTKHNLIISCDTPFLSTQLLEYILDNSNNYDIVVPVHGNSFIEPLAAYYSTNIIPNLESSIKRNNYKLINFFNVVKHKSIKVDSMPGFSKELFRNFNTPGDLSIT